MRNTSELRNDIDAQALRTFASSGFGEAPIGSASPHSLLDSIELYQPGAHLPFAPVTEDCQSDVAGLR